MVAAHRPKAIDRQEVCKKVLASLKKRYSTGALKPELPVLETMLYAICLENSPPEKADEGYARLLNGFHDLNEIRVSSVYELERLFADFEMPEWRALRVKNVLQYVFEATYSFDFDSLKRKTSELAAKQLNKIKSLSPYVRSFVQQNSLGNHVLPIDDRMHAALLWMGLTDSASTPDQTGESLRSHVRKADAQLFCYLLHSLASDPKYVETFAAAASSEEEGPITDGYERLEHLLKHGPPARKEKKAATTNGAKKGETRSRSAAPQPVTKSAAGKAAASKGAATKSTAAKAAAAKGAASKGAAAKAAGKKSSPAKSSDRGSKRSK